MFDLFKSLDAVYEFIFLEFKAVEFCFNTVEHQSGVLDVLLSCGEFDLPCLNS